MSTTGAQAPNDISSADFQHVEEPIRGDARRFRVNLRCRDETATPPGPANFGLSYSITETDWDLADRDGQLDELMTDRHHRADGWRASSIVNAIRQHGR